LVPVVLIAGSWIGWSALEKRFENLSQDKSISEDRFYVWRDSIRHFPNFPVFGTGNGTFEIVEPITRQNLGEDRVIYQNAHNEYVEAIVEGGLARFALTVLFVVIVTVSGIRSYRRHAGRTLGWLLWGGLVGFWAVAIHSLFDFGIHYPAIAMLATILAAHIAAARQSEGPVETTRVPTVACLLIASSMILLGVLLVWQGYIGDRAARYRNAAILEARSADAEAPQRRVAYLEAAVRCQPDNFRYCNELSLAYSELSRLERNPSMAEHDVLESLRYARKARDLSPVFARPQVRLGVNGSHLSRAQSPAWYFERALRSSPTDPTIWFAAGKQRYDSGDLTGAWRDWKRSLDIDLRHFDTIVVDAKKQLTWAELIDQVFPSAPKSIYVAMERLYPEPSTEQRIPFLKRAVKEFDQMGPKRAASDDLLHGKILRELKRDDEAIVALKLGLTKEPSSMALHWELAQAYYDREMFLEAQKEVRFILGRRSSDLQARELSEVLERELILSQ
jgi:tetratricopeptide (TPR) repeat protein